MDKTTQKIIDYAMLVDETRKAQSLYFSVRSSYNLQNALKLEKKLDNATKKILEFSQFNDFNNGK